MKYDRERLLGDKDRRELAEKREERECRKESEDRVGEGVRQKRKRI